MEYIINDDNEKERALLIGVDTGEYDAETSVAELDALADTAGAVTVGKMLQKRSAPDAATYVGSGRLEEMREFCAANDVDIIICDGELSPVQVRNIEDFCNVRTIDRTTLILDIFAGRAQSVEGKLQVELAQLQYSLPRLTGKGTSLSRLGGGIGTRGPGETKLESDKRHIRHRIESLKIQLKNVESRRRAVHLRRQKNRALCVAIVGYTNAGKSTLMNRLTNAGVLQEDKLFATLDPTARKLMLPDGRQIMIVDTVGLVRRLPHELVNAFRSTLEEAVWADVILNVCDASSEECSEHVKVTLDLLDSLGCGDKPVINVLNKCDLVADRMNYPIIGNSVCISAADGTGIDDLLNAICDALPNNMRRVQLLIPFNNAGVLAVIRENGAVHSENYTENGIEADVTASAEYLSSITDYII